ncbi:hypothetical protein ACFQZU_22890, partial [Streptomonospora algeriensis]
RHRRLSEDVAECYESAADRERTTLAELLADEDLRKALALAAPEIHDEAERYRRAVAGSARLPARIRKSERGLLQYATRAMVRTSPLSRFTAVGIAEPAPDGGPPDNPDPAQAVAFPGLDRPMLGYVLGGLDPAPGGDPAADPAAHPEVRVGLAPTSYLDEDAGKLYFLRAGEAGLTRASVAVTGPLGLLLGALSMGHRPAGSVAEDVRVRAGCPAEKAWSLIATALRNGVLCTFAAGEDATAASARTWPSATRAQPTASAPPWP